MDVFDPLKEDIDTPVWISCRVIEPEPDENIVSCRCMMVDSKVIQGVGNIGNN